MVKKKKDKGYDEISRKALKESAFIFLLSGAAALGASITQIVILEYLSLGFTDGDYLIIAFLMWIMIHAGLVNLASWVHHWEAKRGRR